MSYKMSSLLPLALGAALLLSCPIIALAQQPSTTRISVSSSGEQGNDDSGGDEHSPAISADGRYIAFTSSASNLVDNDTNGSHDIFVRDLLTGQTSRVSVSSDGSEANGDSAHVAMSRDGRYVVFASEASHLTLGDNNDNVDIFIHDRQTSQTSLVSLSSTGVQGGDHSMYPVVSDDGRYVAFMSRATNLDNTVIDSNNANDIYVRDRQLAKTTLVSKPPLSISTANGDSNYPSISGNGRYITFVSEATGLVSAPDTNSTEDVFVRDMQTGTISLVSTTPGGKAGSGYFPAISQDGQSVAFSSWASDLIAGDTNNATDIFVRDLTAGQTTRVSLDVNGDELQFNSNLPSISADGRYVSYASYGGNGKAQIFQSDCQTKKTALVSISNNGAEGNDYSIFNAISANGKFVAFESSATNLVTDDTNGKSDFFVRGPLSDFPWPMFLPALTKGKTE